MDTEAIRRQSEVVDAARRAVNSTQKLIAQVSARHGQDCAEIHVNGVVFSVTALNRTYMPEVIRGMESIQRQCIELLQTRLSSERSKLEGAEWKLRQLVKG